MKIVLLSFIRASALVFSLVFLDFGKLSVQFINLMLSFLNIKMLLSDLFFLLLEILGLLLELFDQVFELFLEELVLRHGVQVIDLHTRDFIRNVFDLHLLFGNVFVSAFSLLHHVCARFLNGFLLGSVVHNIITNILCLGMKHHDRFFKHSHFLLNLRSLRFHIFSFLLS